MNKFLISVFTCWTQVLYQGCQPPHPPHPHPLKTIWRFFAKLVLPRKQSLNITVVFFKSTKKVENCWKKYFDQLSGAASTWKLVKIHNKCALQTLVEIYNTCLSRDHACLFPFSGHSFGNDSWDSACIQRPAGGKRVDGCGDKIGGWGQGQQHEREDRLPRVHHQQDQAGGRVSECRYTLDFLPFAIH